MDISLKNAGKVNIITFAGRLDATAAELLTQKMDPLLNETQVCLIANLEQTEYISSSGLRVLLAALKRARKQQGDVRLACLQPYVKEVFDMAGFTQLFKMFEKEEEAINSYK